MNQPAAIQPTSRSAIRKTFNAALNSVDVANGKLISRADSLEQIVDQDAAVAALEAAVATLRAAIEAARG